MLNIFHFAYISEKLRRSMAFSILNNNLNGNDLMSITLNGNNVTNIALSDNNLINDND